MSETDSVESLETQLGLGTGAELAHALVYEAARTSSIRVLFIKGPSLNVLGLRESRTSSDVDVFVDPSRKAALVGNLRSLGWDERPMSGAARLLPNHATHLIHPSWPCDIDVHDQYPGLFTTGTRTFELLWEMKVDVVIAGRSLPCPNKIGSSVIAAIHALREPTSVRNTLELNFLVNVIDSTFTSDELAQVARLSTALRARETLAPFLSRIGIEPAVRDLTNEERRRWRMRISDQTRSLSWLNELITAEWRSKPRVFYSALLPSRAELTASYPGLDDSAISIAGARIRRLVNGSRSLTRGLRAYAALAKKPTRR